MLTGGKNKKLLFKDIGKLVGFLLRKWTPISTLIKGVVWITCLVGGPASIDRMSKSHHPVDDFSFARVIRRLFVFKVLESF